MENLKLRGLGAFGILLALGMASAAAILGMQAKEAVAAREAITVKGLAETPVKADTARWHLTLSSTGMNPAQALASLRAARPKLLEFLDKQQFTEGQIENGNETFYAQYKQNEQGIQTNVVDYYIANQNFVVTTTNVDLAAAASRSLIQLQESGVSVNAGDPEYLVSKLDSVKMSLIAEATKNAGERARQFAKTGGVKVGPMKSASQGSFNILAANGSNPDTGSDYGGVYDTSTIDKIARVVVTIEYSIDR